MSLIHYSWNNIPLVFHGEVMNADLPILTVELAEKWCTLHAVHRVEPEGDGVLLSHRVETVCWPEGMYHDHLPIPELIEEWGFEQGYWWDNNSLDMIYGRWQQEMVLHP